MKCPICLVDVHESWKEDTPSFCSENSIYNIKKMDCPACHDHLIQYERYDLPSQKIRFEMPDSPLKKGKLKKKGFLIPIVEKPKKLDELIPQKYIDLYEESFHVAKHSPKASAALSRLCLQALLREYGKVKPDNLFDEIQQIIDLGKLPSELEDLMNVIRENGNDAVHPSKNTNPGEIVEIEVGEAEWGLDILEDLFDHLIVKPEKLRDRLKKHEKKHKDRNKSQ